MKRRLGEILFQKGLITKEDIEQALTEQQQTKRPIGEILVEQGKVSEKNMLMALGEQLHIDFVELKKIEIAQDAVKIIPAKLATYYKIMPIERADGTITVAVNDPFNHWPLDDIEVNVGYHPKMVLACRDDILEAIRKHYGVGAETVERIMNKEEKSFSQNAAEEPLKEEATEVIKEEGEGETEDATVVRLVDQILQEAVRRGATDIHIEHSRDHMAVRYRVDGMLANARLPENIKYLASAIISRVKIMSWMDIVEKRLPQDGRSRIKIADEEFDLRVSSLPSRYGEDIAIRLLPCRADFHFEQLGMKPETLEALERLIHKPHGIIFVTGPTGSGKSTTLYTCISRIKSQKQKIVTVEDPVEYEIPGITQIQVNSGIGLTFARTLRNILRHDPDIVMIGEVRDPETANIAIQAALTGHLVFSTLHTNDAASGVTRLLDMGIDPFLVASAVDAFVAQRLVRMVCPDCKDKILLKEASHWVKRMGKAATLQARSRLFRGQGCDNCDQTGYKGRTAIYEMLLMDDDIRSLILNRSSANEIKKTAVGKGMLTLWDDGWDKVLSGITTPEEVARVTEENEGKEETPVETS